MGRTSLLMIMAFNIIFALVGKNLGSISSQAYKNYSNYYNVAGTRFVTESAANIAVGQMSVTNGTWIPDGHSHTLFQNGGSYKTVREDLIISGDSAAKFTIQGVYGGIYDTTIILEKLSRYSKYAMFSVNDPTGIVWGANNTCDGPFYTGGPLHIIDNPTFWGPVTAIGGVIKDNPARYNPNFNGGTPKTGPVVPWVTNFNKLATAGQPANGGKTFSGVETYVQFLQDGRVIVRAGSKGWNAVPSDPDPVVGVKACSIYANINALTTSKVLVVQGANLHVKGVLNGQITIASIGATAFSTSSTTYSSIPANGNVYIDSSIAYAAAAPTRAHASNTSDDMLGIVAENETIISRYRNHDATAAIYQNTDIKIEASVLCKNGGLMSEYPSTPYNTTGAPVGEVLDDGVTNYSTSAYGRKQTILLTGGLQAQNRRQVGNGADGFDKHYVYDQRLQTQYPPFYPSMSRMQVISWYDKVHWDENFWD